MPDPKESREYSNEEAASIITRGCIQLHGGIGYTDQYDIGLFLRKMMVLAPLFGAGLWHRASDHHKDAEFAMERLKFVATKS